MNRPAILAAVAFALSSFITWDSHAQSLGDERRKIEAWLKSRYPTIAVADYARGRLAFGDAGSPPDPATLSAAMARGKAAWERKFRNSRTLASCFPNGGKRIAATYPQFDSRSGQVITFEGAINQCLKQHGQPVLDFANSREAGEVLLYARSANTETVMPPYGPHRILTENEISMIVDYLFSQ